MLKKILCLVIAVLGIVLIPLNVNAASGKISITSSSNKVVVGNTVTVTVTLSSSSPLGAWEFDLNYDQSFLKLTSSNAENNGTYFVNYGNGSTKSKSYTLKFKALKSGSTNLTIGSYDVYAFDTSSMSITKSNKSLTLMTQQELEASYSKDNNLKELSVEGFELDKTFDKDTLEYNITVPTGTKTVNIKATANDNTASISGIGEITVTEGLNTIPIIVTAQNGDQKTYNLLINVEDQNPINVTVDNKDYIVIKSASLLNAPSTFSETTITIEGFSIPAFENQSANLVLVGLKDTSGTIGLFIYDNDNYLPYNEMNLKNYLLIPIPFAEPLNLIKTTTTINDTEIEAYKYSKESKFVIINAQNLEDGLTNLYLYDTRNNSAILYDSDYVNEMTNTIKNYSYIIIAFISISIIMLIIIISLLHSSKKKQKKMNKFIEKQEAKLEKTRKLNDVVSEVKKITEEDKKKVKTEPKKEDVKKDEIEVNKIKIDPNNEIKKVLDDEEVYDLFEDEKKSKKKKKKTKE